MMDNIKSPSTINEEDMYYDLYDELRRKKEQEVEQMEAEALQDWSED
jgi:hypothetical protein